MNDYRFTFRVTSEWLAEVNKMAAETPFSVSSFIREATMLGGPELIRRLKGEKIPDKMEDK